MSTPFGLYFITDPEISPLSPLEQAKIAVECQLKVIQYREKHLPFEKQLVECQAIRQVTKNSKTLFIVNDSIDLAKACDADGVHLGQEDDSLKKALEILPNKIIGISASTVPEALIAEKNGASYIGFGAIFPTPSKVDAKIAGVPALAEVMQKVKIEVVAIGGIDKNNLDQILATGCHSIACLRALFDGNLKENIRWFQNKLKPFNLS